MAWFPKAKTGGCTKECKSLKESGKALRRVSTWPTSRQVATRRRFNKEFATSWSWTTQSSAIRPRTWPRLTAWSIRAATDGAGTLTFYIGADGKLLFVDKENNTDGHGAEIAAKLKELGVKKK